MKISTQKLPTRISIFLIPLLCSSVSIAEFAPPRQTKLESRLEQLENRVAELEKRIKGPLVKPLEGVMSAGEKQDSIILSLENAYIRLVYGDTSEKYLLIQMKRSDNNPLLPVRPFFIEERNTNFRTIKNFGLASVSNNEARSLIIETPEDQNDRYGRRIQIQLDNELFLTGEKSVARFFVYDKKTLTVVNQQDFSVQLFKDDPVKR